jgi:hypothetical protein
MHDADRSPGADPSQVPSGLRLPIHLDARLAARLPANCEIRRERHLGERAVQSLAKNWGDNVTMVAALTSWHRLAYVSRWVARRIVVDTPREKVFEPWRSRYA